MGSATWRHGGAALVVMALGLGFALLQGMGPDGRPLGFSLAIGAGFGLVLQRSRFCFYCNFRDFLERGDPRGLLAILAALAVGAIGYTAIFGAWLPTPAPDRLPPTAHIGPLSLTLALASFVFGIGMSVSGSCLSAHLYRLGEGAAASPFALLGAAFGFGIGFLTWNGLFLPITSNAVIAWLPHWLGYAGSLLATLAAIALLAVLLLARARPVAPAPAAPLTLASALEGLLVRRWPALTGGILVGAISTLAYFRVAPLGVTAELGSLVRTAGTGAALLPETLFGLDGLRGCAAVVKDALLSNNGLFVLGLVGASLAAALVADQFKPRRPTLNDALRGLGGGVLMGWGAMTALGCTVGVLLSGIHAGSLSGWAFLLFCSLGILAARALGKSYARLSLGRLLGTRP